MLDALVSEPLEQRVEPSDGEGDLYQSILASRSETGTPAKRWVIALISGR